MNVITDLNSRERARHADSLECLAQTAVHTAKSLRATDDTEALVGIIAIGLTLQRLTELKLVFENAISATLPDDLSTLVPEPKEKTT